MTDDYMAGATSTEGNMRVAFKITVTLFVALVLSVLTFNVIGLAFDLFNHYVGLIVNLAIIAVFMTLWWKFKFILIGNLRILR